LLLLLLLHRGGVILLYQEKIRKEKKKRRAASCGNGDGRGFLVTRGASEMGRPVAAGGKVARKMRNSRAESLKLARRWSFPLCPGLFSCVMTVG
jgi:hypothetical protein